MSSSSSSSSSSQTPHKVVKKQFHKKPSRPGGPLKPWYITGIWPDKIGVRHAYNLVKNRIPENKWTVVRGDHVGVVCGKLKGKTGIVAKVMRKISSVVIEGVNLRKKHRVGITGEQESYMQPMPIHRSLVNHIDPVTNRPVRIKVVRSPETNRRVRVTVGRASSGSVLPRPHPHEFFERKAADGPTETPFAEAFKVTYCGDPAEDYLSWMRETAQWMGQVRLAAEEERRSGRRMLERGYVTRMSRPHTGFGIFPDPPSDPEVAKMSMLALSKNQKRYAMKNPLYSETRVDVRGSMITPALEKARRDKVHRIEVRRARMRRGMEAAGVKMGVGRRPHNRWWLAYGGTPKGFPVDPKSRGFQPPKKAKNRARV